MKFRWLTGGALVVVVAGIGQFACSSEGTASTPTYGPIGVPPDASVDAPPVALPDASVDAPPVVTGCGTLAPIPSCATTTKAPTAPSDVSAFIGDLSVNLRCQAGGAPLWDLRRMTESFGNQKIFMVGEIHGSNEIGIFSSMMLDELVSKKLVNLVGYELPADYEAYLQSYVDTGSDPEQLLSAFAPNMFGSILTKGARDWAAKGTKLTLAAVDIPQSPDFAAAEIQQIAQKLSTQKTTVLSTLPQGLDMPPTPQQASDVQAYFTLVTQTKKAEICAELTADDCDRLNSVVHALWASAFAYDQDVGQTEEWFARREVAIYSNMRMKMRTAQDRMLLHMGAFHTNKYAMSAGSRMANEYALTKGQVFSVGPANAAGSIIHYGQDQPVEANPQVIANALTSASDVPIYLSAHQPSAACVANPLANLPDQVGTGGKAGDQYDGFVFYGKLTSEAHPEKATFAKGTRAFALQAFRENVLRREKTALQRMHVRQNVKSPF